jgi:hypothetical protein
LTARMSPISVTTKKFFNGKGVVIFSSVANTDGYRRDIGPASESRYREPKLD